MRRWWASLDARLPLLRLVRRVQKSPNGKNRSPLVTLLHERYALSAFCCRRFRQTRAAIAHAAHGALCVAHRGARSHHCWHVALHRFAGCGCPFAATDGRHFGASAYLAKGARPAEILDTIHQVMARPVQKRTNNSDGAPHTLLSLR